MIRPFKRPRAATTAVIALTVAGAISGVAQAGAPQRHPKYERITPTVGYPSTTFTVRYFAIAADGNEAYELDIRGPAGTACAGPRVFVSPSNTRPRVLTLHLGPHAAISPVDVPGGRWCVGRWTGEVHFYLSPASTGFDRFSFLIKRPS